MMKKLLILALLSFGLSAMENEVAPPLSNEDVAGPLAGEDLAALIVKDLLTNADSRWLDETSSYILSKDLSRYIAQLMLKDTNFARVLKPTDVICKGHTDIVTSTQFSPDGKTIVTSENNTAKLWDLEGNCPATLKGHDGYLISTQFSPNGRTIVTASEDNTAKLWDLKGNCITTFKGHTAGVSSAQFNPDSDKIVTTSRDYTAKLWDLEGNCLATLNHVRSASAQFSPDGQNILAKSTDNTAKLWDLKGNCITTFKGHTDSVFSTQFSPDGQTILTASWDNTAKLWDLEGNCLATLKTPDILSAQFSPDGKTIATVSNDGTASISYIEDPYLSKQVTLPQALILVAINAIKWDRKKLEDKQILTFYEASFGECTRRDSNSDEVIYSPENIRFDFNKYPHLQKHYEALPDYIQVQCDNFVTKIRNELEEE